MSLEVRRYCADDQSEWDALVGRSRSAHFLFRRAYMDYHADRFEDHSLLVCEGSRLAAALPANREGTEIVSHAGLTFGGILSDARMSTRRMLEAFEAIEAHLLAEGVRTWVYKPVPHIYNLVPAEEDLYALYRHGAALVGRHVSSAIRLDARLPYAKGRRSDVRVAEREPISVELSDDFGAFMELQREVLEDRYGAEPVHTAAELARLAERFPDEITLHTAALRGQLVAGVVVYCTPAVARSQYIAVSEEGRRAHALDRIVDTLIRSYEGTKGWWDFGASSIDSGRALNEGLIRNKESYGARAVVYDTYRVELGARVAP